MDFLFEFCRNIDFIGFMYGKRLKNMLAAKGYTSGKQISELLGIPASSYGNYVKSEYPPLHIIEKACSKILGIHLWEFFITKDDIEKITQVPKSILVVWDEMKKLPVDVRKSLIIEFYHDVCDRIKFNEMLLKNPPPVDDDWPRENSEPDYIDPETEEEIYAQIKNMTDEIEERQRIFYRKLKDFSAK